MSDTRTTPARSISLTVAARSISLTLEGDLLVANEDGIHITRVKRDELEQVIGARDKIVRVATYQRFSQIRSELQRCIHDSNAEHAAEAVRADELAREGMLLWHSEESLQAAACKDADERAELKRKLEEAEAALTSSKVREVVDDRTRLRAALDATQAKLDGTDLSRAAAWRERDELSDQVSELSARLERVRALAVAALQPGEEPTDWHAALGDIDRTLRANEAETSDPRAARGTSWPLRRAKIRQALKVIDVEWMKLSRDEISHLVEGCLAALDDDDSSVAATDGTAPERPWSDMFDSDPSVAGAAIADALELAVHELPPSTWRRFDVLKLACHRLRGATWPPDGMPGEPAEEAEYNGPIPEPLLAAAPTAHCRRFGFDPTCPCSKCRVTHETLMEKHLGVGPDGNTVPGAYQRAVGRTHRQGQQLDRCVVHTEGPRIEIVSSVDIDATLNELARMCEGAETIDVEPIEKKTADWLVERLRRIHAWVDGFARRRIDELGEELKLAPVRERARWSAAMRLAANRTESGREDRDIERSWLHATYGWAHRIDANDARAQLDGIGVRRPIVFFGPLPVPPQVAEIRSLLDVLEEHSRLTLVVLQGLDLDWLDDCIDGDYDDDDPGHALTLQYVHLYQKLLAGLQKIEAGRIAIARGTGRALP